MGAKKIKKKKAGQCDMSMLKSMIHSSAEFEYVSRDSAIPVRRDRDEA